jgi:hypothetical protein
MAPIAMVLAGSKNTNRVGSLILLSALASATRPSAAGDLATQYRQALSRLVPVPVRHRAEIEAFLRARNLARKYSSWTPVETQDWLLSDPRLPSGTGSEREDVRPAVGLASALQVLWPQNLQRSWLGGLLVREAPDALTGLQSGDRSRNPFVLTPRLRLVGTWMLLRADWVFMDFLVRHLRDTDRCSITGLIPVVSATFQNWVGELQERYPQAPNAPTLAALRRKAALLSRPVGGRARVAGAVTEQTMRREFEELLMWRLELLVDLGFLSKSNRLALEYRVLPRMTELAAVLADASEGLFNGLFSRTIGREATADSSVILDALAVAATTAKNAMGYSVIEESVLLANLAALEDPTLPVLEVRKAMDVLRQGSQASWRVVTSVDRDRVLSAYKLVPIRA